MRCIECNYPLVHHHHHHHHHQQRDITSTNGVTRSTFCERLQKRKRHGMGIVVPQVVPLNVEAFPIDWVTLGVAAKPPDNEVLVKTGGLMLFVYLIANFLVPQLISKSWGLDQTDENQKPNNIDSGPGNETDGKPRSTSAKRGFNSTKPK